MIFKGLYTAIITPFKKDGSIDEKAFKTLVEEQIAAGVDGLVPMGTTGESPTLDHPEHLDVIKKVVLWTNGRVPILAGTGSNSTKEALELTRKAKDLGATGSLQVIPYYNRPNQEGLYAHFMALADGVDLPLVVYNHPGRTGRNMEADTLLKLAKHPNIVGVKEASGNIDQCAKLLAERPANFSVLSGDDQLLLPLLSLGADGLISVASHLVPRELSKLIKTFNEGKVLEARQLHFKLLPLFQLLMIDMNPIPVKSALALQEKIEDVLRLPMTRLSDNHKLILKDGLKSLGLL